MAAVRTLVLGGLVLGLLGSPSRGAAIETGSWRWAAWSAQGVSLGGGTISVANFSTPSFDNWAPAPVVTSQLPTFPSPAPISAPAPAPVPLPAFSAALPTTPSAPATPADAYLDMGPGPYPGEATLTSGGAQAWFNSPMVQQLNGGPLSTDQRAAFTQNVLQRIEQTYQQSGVPVHLTTDPHVQAAHTISVVSGTSYPGSDAAVGITNVGHDGFSFIDKLPYAKSLDELEWAVARNSAHELMHAFGGDHHDTTGHYLDAAITPWSILIDPKTTFGPESVQQLKGLDFRQVGGGYGLGGEEIDGMLLASPVPEPATLLLWAAALSAGLLARRRLRRSS